MLVYTTMAPRVEYKEKWEKETTTNILSVNMYVYEKERANIQMVNVINCIKKGETCNL